MLAACEACSRAKPEKHPANSETFYQSSYLGSLTIAETDVDAPLHIHSIKIMLLHVTQSSIFGVTEAANISGAGDWKYRKLGTGHCILIIGMMVLADKYLH